MSLEYRPITAEDAALLGPAIRRSAFDQQFPPPTLVNRDFSRYNLAKFDLSGRNLSGVNFTGANLDHAKLDGCTLAGTIFNNTNLINTKFTGCSATRLEFNGCNLSSNAFKYSANFDGVNFINCRFAGCIMEEAQFNRATLDQCTFIRCEGMSVEFFECSLIGAIFSNCEMGHVHIGQALLDNVQMSECDFTNAFIHDSSFNDAVLTDVKLTGVDLNWDNYLNIFDGAILADVEGVPDFVPQDVIIGAPEEERPPEGVAYEIHNANDRIDMAKLKSILAQGVQQQTTVEDMVANLNRLLSFIAKKNRLFQDAHRTSSDMHDVAMRLLQSEYSRNPQTIEIVNLALNYVLRQPAAFIAAYIEVFVEDCAHAYSSGDNTMSCVNGIIERTYFSIFEAMRVICPAMTAECLTPEQQSLAAVFGSVNLASEANKWFEANADRPEMQNMDAGALKQRFIADMTAAHPNVDRWTTEKIARYADTLDYAFNNKLQLGGNRQRRRPRPLTGRRKTKRGLRKIKKRTRRR
jgi:uncharacterized protein YjbI with pentapeptide repeats